MEVLLQPISADISTADNHQHSFLDPQFFQTYQQTYTLFLQGHLFFLQKRTLLFLLFFIVCVLRLHIF